MRSSKSTAQKSAPPGFMWGYPGRLARLGLLVVLCGGLFACQTTDAKDQKASAEEMVGSAPTGPESEQLDQNRPSQRDGQLWYQLRLTEERAEVFVRLFNPPELTTFFLPGKWAGRSNFDDNISILGARDEEGSTSFRLERSERRIDIESAASSWVELAYSVDFHEDRKKSERFHPGIDAGIAFAYGPTFLLLPSEQISRQIGEIPVEVRTETTWQVLTTWQRVDATDSEQVDGERVYGFVAPGPGALRDTFVAAGPDLAVERPATPAEHSRLTIGFSPRVETDREHFADSIAQLVEAYRDRFGDLGAVTAYVRGVVSRDTRRPRGVGRRGGFVVELPAEQPLDKQSMLLLAHEAFHLWNGHYLTPAPDEEKKTRWFKEGVTHYMALQTLAQLELFSQRDVLEELERAARYYERNPAAKRREANSEERARLPYDRGVLLAVGLDATLVRESNGELGLGDWVATLLDQRAKAGERYGEGDLREALVEVTGSSNSAAVDFWDDHVAASKSLEPGGIFEVAGLHWLDGAKSRRARLLPLDAADSPFSSMFPTLQ